MRISDWSSDVCSSDLDLDVDAALGQRGEHLLGDAGMAAHAHTDDGNLHHVGIGAQLLEVELRLVATQHANGALQLGLARSEERRVGKGRVSTCRSRWSPYN